MGGVVGWEVAKILRLGQLWSRHDTHTIHANFVGHKAMRAILSSHHPIGTLDWCYCSGHVFRGSEKCPPGKQTC